MDIWLQFIFQETPVPLAVTVVSFKIHCRIEIPLIFHMSSPVTFYSIENPINFIIGNGCETFSRPLDMYKTQ